MKKRNSLPSQILSKTLKIRGSRSILRAASVCWKYENPV